MSDPKELVNNYLRENTLKDANKIEDSTLIFQEGFFDSMGFVLLIDFIENKFGIRTSDEDLVEENFESVNAISKYIARKLNSN
jgi:acyl carrier protein